MQSIKIEVPADDAPAIKLLGQALIDIAAVKSTDRRYTPLTQATHAEDNVEDVVEDNPEPVSVDNDTEPFDEQDKSADEAKADLSVGLDNLGLDINGLPWDERIHTAKKTKKKDGAWKNTRNLDQGFIESIEKELLSGSAPTPPAVEEEVEEVEEVEAPVTNAAPPPPHHRKIKLHRHLLT